MKTKIVHGLGEKVRSRGGKFIKNMENLVWRTQKICDLVISFARNFASLALCGQFYLFKS